jgi:hypothetical protein
MKGHDDKTCSDQFRNMTVFPAIEEEIRSRAAWLESFHPVVVG